MPRVDEVCLGEQPLHVRGRSFTSSAGITLALFLSTCIVSIPGGAAPPAADVLVEIPGLGTVDIDQLPPELRGTIRIPGVIYEDAEEEYADLPPAPAVPRDEIPAAADVTNPEAANNPAAASEVSEPRTPEEHRALEEEVQRKYPPEDPVVRELLYNGQIGSDVPSNAYRGALEHLRNMDVPTGSDPKAPPEQPPGPESWLNEPLHWLARLFDEWPVSHAWAQSAQCSNAPVWSAAGPAAYEFNDGNPNDYFRNAGIIKYVAVDPSSSPSSRTLFVGTRNGGVWKTTNGGTSWTTTTDNLVSPNNTSLQSEAIAVHPTNSNIVMAGTGVGPKLGEFDATPLNKSIGVLRSTDGGASWAQIGPCKTSDACGSDPTKSTVNVKEIVIDTFTATARVWAATNYGLWYSDDAVTASLPSQVTWTRVTALANRSNGDPEWVNHIFVLNNAVLFTSIQHSDFVGTHNGWYRSTNREQGPWTQILALSTTSQCLGTGTCQNPYRATYVKGNTPGTNDAIYSLISNVWTSCPNGVVGIERIYKTTNSGGSWSLVSFPNGSTCEGQPCNVLCDVPLSIQADPQNAATFVFGGVQLYRSTDGGTSATRIGLGSIHPDQNALTFDPSDHTLLYIGNDGGISSATFPYSAKANFTFIGGNLANLEFYAGAVDTADYAISSGGLQDNGTEKGGNPLLWDGLQAAGGDGQAQIIDPYDSRVAYYLSGPTVNKTTNGGQTQADIPSKGSGLPGTPLNAIAMDPTDNQALVVWAAPPPPPTPGGARIYRTTTGAEQPAPQGTPTPAWFPISQALSVTFNSIAVVPAASPVPSPAIASNRIFAASDGQGVWKTEDASTWSRVDQSGLPTRRLTSIAIDTSTQCGTGIQLCSASCPCTLYVTAYDFDDSIPGHVFRSTDSGATWSNASGSGSAALPNVPANKLVVHPSCPNFLYVGTDLGLYQGTLNNGTCGTTNNGTWTWCAYTNGFPKTALVKDLLAHKDAGILRAFTFGRSVWEVQAFPLPNPDYRVNSTNPITEIQRNSQRISSNVGPYAVAWADDRLGANNWHVYIRSYTYDSTGAPTDYGSEQRVDTTNNTHVAQMPAVSIDPSATGSPSYSRLAWHDDRLNPGINQHIYTQYIGSNGYKLFSNDLRVDQHATNISATNAAIAFQPSKDFAVAWQADRVVGGSLHDVYARFLNALGGNKGNGEFQVSATSSTVDATFPAVAYDGSNNIFIAWEEYDTNPTTDYRIMVARYDPNGVLLNAATRIDNQASNTVRHDVSLAVQNVCSGSGTACTLSSDCPSGQTCGATAIIAAWWEGYNNGPETVFRRRLSNALTPLEGVTQVNAPPKAPIGAQRGGAPSIAVDVNNNFAIAWNASANAYDSTTYSGFAKSFDPNGVVLKNDFRVDLAAR